MLARDCDRDIRLYADAADGENCRLLALVRDALPLSKSSQYIVLSSHRLLVDDGSTGHFGAEVTKARSMLQRAICDAVKPLHAERAPTPPPPTPATAADGSASREGSGSGREGLRMS